MVKMYSLEVKPPGIVNVYWTVVDVFVGQLIQTGVVTRAVVESTPQLL